MQHKTQHHVHYTGCIYPLVSQAHIRLRRTAGNMGSNCLAKVAGVQAQLLANDHIHCLSVGLPQAWQSCWLYCLNNLQDRQVSPEACIAARHLQLQQQVPRAAQDSPMQCNQRVQGSPCNISKDCKQSSPVDIHDCTEFTYQLGARISMMQGYNRHQQD